MKAIGGLDPLIIAELEALLGKLAARDPSPSGFTPRERELMSLLRANREVVLRQLHAVVGAHTGINERGRAKIVALVEGIEKICALPSD